MRGSHCGPSRTGMRHGWYVLQMVMRRRKICHVLIPILDLLGLGLSHVSVCDQEEDEGSVPSEHDPQTRPCAMQSSEHGSKSFKWVVMGPIGPCVLSDRMALSGRTLQEFSPDQFSEVAQDVVHAMEKGWLQDLEPVGMLLRLVPV